jgi:hypothetical protein
MEHGWLAQILVVRWRYVLLQVIRVLEDVHYLEHAQILMTGPHSRVVF